MTGMAVNGGGGPRRLNAGNNPFKKLAAVQSIFDGGEYVCTHSGLSQYSEGGSSACGIAALNCVRILLSIEHDGGDLVKEVLERDTMQDIMSICSLWPSNAHVELEDIYNTPLFSSCLNLVTSEYGMPDVQKFADMIRELDRIIEVSNGQHSCAVVITRPPEIVVCLKVVHTTQDLYVIFDSHPREKHPDGGAFVINTSAENTVHYLASLLQFDKGLLDAASGLEWQAQLLGNVSGHFFVSSNRDISMSDDVFNTLLEASFSLLTLRTSEAALKSQCSALTADYEGLQRQIKASELDRRRGREEIERLRRYIERLTEQVQTVKQEYTTLVAAFPTQEEIEREESNKLKRRGKPESSERNSGLGGFQSLAQSALTGVAQRVVDLVPERRAPKNYYRATASSSSQIWDDRQLQGQKEKRDLDLALSMSLAQTDIPQTEALTVHNADENYKIISVVGREPLGKGKERQVGLPVNGKNPFQKSMSGPHPPPVNDQPHDKEDKDFELAMRMQMEFHDEDALLRLQLQYLQSTAQKIFNCIICMDEQPEDDVARVDGCRHSFCRDCLRGHVIAQIQGNTFPVVCPSCSSERDLDKKKQGIVSELLIRQLGLEEKDFAKFMEFQLLPFSIIMECRKCKRSGPVDRSEFDGMKILSCPFPKCGHSWCKACQQPATEAGNPPHSCDGTNELNGLMLRKGWKHCPRCKTPTEKTSGCNHMTCGTPGCNTHFCYLCGGDMHGRSSHNCPR